MQRSINEKQKKFLEEDVNGWNENTYDKILTRWFEKTEHKIKPSKG